MNECPTKPAQVETSPPEKLEDFTLDPAPKLRLSVGTDIVFLYSFDFNSLSRCQELVRRSKKRARFLEIRLSRKTGRSIHSRGGGDWKLDGVRCK
jgi:hypothetical protein